MSDSIIKLSSTDRKRFGEIQKQLLAWYKINRREFSWRMKIRHPYEVLVCEVMGQQTQASRIEQFLPRFLKRFPTIQALSSAKKSDVIREWQGLGYNRRALNLQRAAVELVNKPFPKTTEELLKLPGIGHYTANAVLIFAYNKPLATIDVNIERVISRLFKKMPDVNSMLPKNDIIQIAEAILPAKQSRLWHEALMDFGAAICTKRSPQCSECLLYKECKSGKVLIKKTKIEPKKSYQETIYFGHPKRIWRGKVLKIISQNNGVKESQIINTLLSNENKQDLKTFMRNVLSDLVKEGFCEINKNNIYRLS